jgi:RNA polymerase sigma-70 factor (ECF subfamily)
MAGAPHSPQTPMQQGAWFTTTHWSIVLHAQDPASPEAKEALERLCRAYWYPLYVFVRRQGYDDAAAKDLTQGFFAKLLEKNYLADVHPEKGRFRSFLMVAIKHFISDHRDKARAQKRGGGRTFVSWDDTSGEDRYRHEPVDLMDAEKLFERRWVLTLMEQAGNRLKEEYRAAGKAELFAQLQLFESGEKDAPSYAEVAPKLNLTESGLRTAVHRMRHRHLELLRLEVAQTVDKPAEVDEEIRYLLRVMSA